MIKYHSTVLFVKNIERAKEFYTEFLSMPIEMDMGKNVALKSGISLWEIGDDNILVKNIGKKIMGTGVKSELYFETSDIDNILQSIDKKNIRKIHDLHEEPWGQKTVRFYDYDENIIEIGEELKIFLDRMIKSGMSQGDLCNKTGMKLSDIEKSVGYKI